MFRICMNMFRDGCARYCPLAGYGTNVHVYELRPTMACTDHVSQLVIRSCIHGPYISHIYSIPIPYVFHTYSTHIQNIFHTYSILNLYILHTYSIPPPFYETPCFVRAFTNYAQIDMWENRTIAIL